MSKRYEKVKYSFASLDDYNDRIRHIRETLSSNNSLRYLAITFSRIEKFELPSPVGSEDIIRMCTNTKHRIDRLRKEGRNVSLIDLSLYEIFLDKDDAEEKYEEMVRRKTKKFGEMKGSIKDSKSMRYFESKFGCELGSEKYNEERGKMKERSPRCKEYWMKNGFDYSESVEKVKKYQAKGSLANFRKRYGDIEGYSKWRARQDKWQNSLNNKNTDEMCDINHRKSELNNIVARFVADPDPDILKYRSELAMACSRLDAEKIVFTRDDLDSILKDMSNELVSKGLNGSSILSKISKTQFALLGIVDEKEYVSAFIPTDYVEPKLVTKYGGYSMHVEEGYLRSSYEIYFYNLCRNRINFTIGKTYPNCKYRYDFYLNDLDMYIEISPNYDKVENVKKIIDDKISIFGDKVKLLKSYDEIQNFINSILASSQVC